MGSNRSFTPAQRVVNPHLQAFLPFEWRKTCTCRFSSAPRGGKPALAALPPFSSAVKLQLPVFLRSEWRKTRTCSFSAVLSGGKAAFEAFPPLLSAREPAHSHFLSPLCLGRIRPTARMKSALFLLALNSVRCTD